MAAAMAGLFGLVALIERSRSAHLGLWALAFLAQGVGLFLLYLRGSIPDLASLAVGNTLIIASLQLLHAGIVRFGGERPNWPIQGVVNAAALVVLALVAGRSYVLFGASVSLFAGGIELAIVARLIRRVDPRLRTAQALVALLFAIDLVSGLARLVWLLLRPAPTPLFAPAALTSLHYLRSILGTLLLGSSLGILVYRRADLEQKRAIGELEAALGQVRVLQGLLPICAWCKRIQDEDGAWHEVERYVSRRTKARFSHGICPDCAGRFAAAER